MINNQSAKEIYKEIKEGTWCRYDEELHCEMILEIMMDEEEGTVSSFCVKAKISDATFYRWVNKYEIFRECYRYGYMVSQRKWEERGRNGADDETFSLDVWKFEGATRYGAGKSNRVRIQADPDISPSKQYKQLIAQAVGGDFTASELKQIMECIGIGMKAYQLDEMQAQIDEIKENQKKLDQNNVIDTQPNQRTQEEDQDSISHQVCG